MEITYLSNSDPSQLLRGATTPEQRSQRVLQEFESILVREVLKSAPRASLSGDGKQGQSKVMGEIYGDLMNDVVATQISRSGQLGLRDTLARQLSHQMGRLEADRTKPSPGDS
jgi:Rod binding domain-containing protein